MRTAFIKTLTKEAIKNKEIILITADLGFSVFEEYMEKLPRQYLNAGIAEQNMTGMAAGMAMEGRVPFIYSIVPFATMRNFEQIRDDICYQNLNVKIIGVGAGYSYGSYGHTHHGLEDVGILRTLPNLTIFTPGDPRETEYVTKLASQINGPVYIRLGRAGEPELHSKNDSFNDNKIFEFSSGRDVTIFTMSTMLSTGNIVKRKLEDKGIKAGLVSVLCVKPLDREGIIKTLKSTKLAISLEEHFITGGLGSAMAEVIAEEGISTRFKRIGVQDKFTKEIGRQEYMRMVNDLDPEKITERILNFL